MARKSPTELSILEKAMRVKRQLDKLCPNNDEALKILSLVRESTTPNDTY